MKNFALCLSVLGFSLYTGVSAGATPEKTIRKPLAPLAKLTADDRLVMQIALVYFVSLKNVYSFKSSKPDSIIVVDDKTPDSGFTLDSLQIGSELNQRTQEIPAEMLADLRQRNTKVYSLKSIKALGSKVIVDDFDKYKDNHAKSRNGFYGNLLKRYPTARNYASIWLPGYSKDYRQAIVRLSFGPTAHGATATIVLIKKNQRWIVKWHNRALYA